MIPTKIMLQELYQKPNENFRQYAKTWRDLATQIQPPIPESELTSTFINTLKGTMYVNMLNNTTKGFADMVHSG